MDGLVNVISLLWKGGWPACFTNYIRYKVSKRHVNQLVVPAILIPSILNLKHDHAGHMGADKTTGLIRREYFWLSMVHDVKEYCKSCLACARSHPALSRPSEPFTVTSQPEEPWQEIEIYIKVPFGKKPTNNGNCYICFSCSGPAHSS